MSEMDRNQDQGQVQSIGEAWRRWDSVEAIAVIQQEGTFPRRPVFTAGSFSRVILGANPQ